MTELVKQAGNSRAEVIAALVEGTKSNSPEISASSRKTIERIFSVYELGQGELAPGFETGWFVAFEDGRITTYPLVISVEKGSPAEKAGLWPGDVIRKCQDLDCGGPAAKNELVRQLAILPGSTPLRLVVGRTKFRTHMRDRAIRSETVELDFKPVTRKVGASDSFPHQKFEDWLAGFTGGRPSF